MKPHVKHVLELWKNSFQGSPPHVAPYQLTRQLQNFASIFVPGNFYYYVLDFPNLKMEYVHHTTRDIIGIDAGEVTIEKLVSILAPNEREAMARKEAVVIDFFMNFLDPEEIKSYKALYFFAVEGADGKYRKMLHQISVLSVCKKNLPEHVIVVHTDVSHLNYIDNNKISFIHVNGGKSYFEVNSDSAFFEPENAEEPACVLHDLLSHREKEIVSLISKGSSVEEIADMLNISCHTVRTHRKNILKKTGCKNSAELVAKCLLEVVIK